MTRTALRSINVTFKALC